MTRVKCIIFDIRRTVLVPGVSPCTRICAMMHYVKSGEAVVTRKELPLFCLSPQGLYHTQDGVCILKYDSVFFMDTGQPLVTNNGI